jgi:hypothetical protein
MALKIGSEIFVENTYTAYILVVVRETKTQWVAQDKNNSQFVERFKKDKSTLRPIGDYPSSRTKYTQIK